MDRSQMEQAPDERIGRLTNKEREALRLVQRRLTSKEIAPLLGIQPDAVDARIKSATRKLGMQDRGKAAMLLAEHEGASPYQRLVYPSPDVAADHPGAILRGPTADVAREVQQPFIVERPPEAADAQASAPREGEIRNRLGSWQRVVIIAAIAIGTIIAAGVLVSTLNGLVQLALSRGRLF
jgi:DNA-binding CsgD family transcriptional regulator